MAQQTAVEWLENELKKIPFIKPQDAFEQAKAMEKQQITYAYNNGVDDAYADEYKEMDGYYNKTYNK